MTSIGNQISFNTAKYDVDKSNGTQSQSSVRQNFAEKLNQASADGVISDTEKAELQELSQTGTAAEKSIVAQFSKAATAAFDPDADGNIAPVQISFGTPAPATKEPPQTAPTGNVGAPPTRTQGTINAKIGEFGEDVQISRRMASFLDSATRSGRGIGYEEFQRLATIAAETGTPGDLAIARSIADLASTQKDDKKATENITIGSQPARAIRINDAPPPEGRGGFGNFINGFINQTLPNIAAQWAEQEIRRVTGTQTPTGQPPATPSPTIKK